MDEFLEAAIAEAKSVMQRFIRERPLLWSEDIGA